MYTSAADRMAVSRALEATLMIIEQENVFCKQLQTPNGGEQSDAGSVRISAENFDLLQGAFTEAKSFSPEAKMMYTKVCEIAAKIINERLSREDGPVSDPPRKRRDQTSEPDGLLLRGP
jgi:hypothetical protein